MPTIRVKFGGDKHVSHITFVGEYKAGVQPPTGYMDWHEWAKVQHKAGLRQTQCSECGLWKFPQELSDADFAGTNKAVCNKCAAKPEKPDAS